MNKDLNDVSQRLVFSLLGGGIHVEEDRDGILKLDTNDNFRN